MEQIKQAWEIMSGGEAFKKLTDQEIKKRKFEEELKRAAEEYHKKNPGKASDPYSFNREKARADKEASENAKRAAQGYSEEMKGYKY